MKSVIISMIILITIVSCNQIDNKKINSNTIDRFQYDDSQKLLKFLNNFIETDSTITNNNETIKNSSIRLRKELTEFLKINDSIFYQLPIKLSDVYKVDGGYYGKFFTINELTVSDLQSEDKKKKISKGSNKIERLSSVVIVKLNKDDISSLKEGNIYKVVGNFKYFLSNCEFLNRKLNVSDCNPKIEKGIWSEQLVSFDLGLLYLETTLKLEITEPNIRGVEYFKY